MNEPREHDPLIDSLLDEVLGGVRPPDLTQKILSAYAARKQANGRHVSEFSDLEVEPPAPLSVLPSKATRSIDKAVAAEQDLDIEAPPVIAQPRPARLPVELPIKEYAPERGTKRRSSSLAWVAIAASIAVVVLAASYFGWNPAGPNGDTIVSNDPDKEGRSPDTGDNSANAMVSDGSKSPSQDNSANKNSAVAKTNTNTSPETATTNTDGNSEAIAANGHREDSHDDVTPDEMVAPNVPGTNGSELATNQTEGHQKRSRKQVDVAMVKFINTQLAAAWKDAGVTPSPVATDSEWCRRVYLRLLGRVPKREELDRFVASKVRTKREDLVEMLMNGPTSRHEYAAHWASIWTSALIGRAAGMKPEEPASRAGLEEYLRTAIDDDKPYHAMVQDLLTATGSGKPVENANSETSYNGAVNFLLANHSENGSLAAARSSRVFLGVQLQCAQCHAHPTNNISQHQFWAFNSFFRQLELKKTGGKSLLVSRDFAGESGKNPDEAEVYYEQRNGVLKAAYPEFPDGTPANRSGRLADNDRRKALADWIVKSDRLGQAAANRLWAHFFGYGFTRPVDDIGGDNPPSHPQLLEKLGHEFADEGYSLKRLSKWIVLSDAFGRSSKILPANAIDSPEAGERPLFAHYYTRQMQAEEVYQSLLIAAKLRETNSDPLAARTQWSGQFARNMETDEGDEESSFNGSIKQQLTMMNGELMRKATLPGGGHLLDTVIASKMSFEEKVEHLFLSALSRRPHARELDAARQLRQSNAKELAAEATALSDIWWALLNSNEFILDH